jgi:hypothetical protein
MVVELRPLCIRSSNQLMEKFALHFMQLVYILLPLHQGSILPSFSFNLNKRRLRSGFREESANEWNDC